MDNKLENLNLGLRNYTKRCEDVKQKDLSSLLTLHAGLEVLIYSVFKDGYSKEIAYKCQDLQTKISRELQERIEK